MECEGYKQTDSTFEEVNEKKKFFQSIKPFEVIDTHGQNMLEMNKTQMYVRILKQE